MDDFLVAASPPGRAVTESDAESACKVLGKLLNQLGLKRQIGKGCWDGPRTIDHLGMHIDTTAMRMYVSADKL